MVGIGFYNDSETGPGGRCRVTFDEEENSRGNSNSCCVLIKANKMTVLLQREKAKNDAYIQPLRENAQKLAFLREVSKSNDGIYLLELANIVLPLSETTDFLADQLRTLLNLLRTLRSLPKNAKQGTTDEVRRLYLEKLVSRRMAEVGILDGVGEGWKEQKERYNKIGSLEDIRKLEGRN